MHIHHPPSAASSGQMFWHFHGVAGYRLVCRSCNCCCMASTSTVRTSTLDNFSSADAKPPRAISRCAAASSNFFGEAPIDDAVAVVIFVSAFTVAVIIAAVAYFLHVAANAAFALLFSVAVAVAVLPSRSRSSSEEEASSVVKVVSQVVSTSGPAHVAVAATALSEPPSS